MGADYKGAEMAYEVHLANSVRKKLRIPERISPPATTPIGLILSLGCPTSKKAPNSIKKKEFLKDHHTMQLFQLYTLPEKLGLEKLAI